MSNGLPPLGAPRGSASSPSENTSHIPATLHVCEFSLVQNIPWSPQQTSAIWATAHTGYLRSWGSEREIQTAVTLVLQDLISSVGLEDMLRCYQELSIFKLRADIWIVVDATGVPVGVVEVKKPGKKIMQSDYVHGQIYDYMMRLRSFHGLKHVFGIVSTYNQWRVYWLNDCNEIAQSTSYRLTGILPKEEPPDPGSGNEDSDDIGHDIDELIEEQPQSRYKDPNPYPKMHFVIVLISRHSVVLTRP